MFAQRMLIVVLGFLLFLGQYALWFGKDSWVTVWKRRDKLSAWISYNDTLRKRNKKLSAEVDNLLHGREVMIERARYRLGLVSPDEIFVYVYGDSPTIAKNNPKT